MAIDFVQQVYHPTYAVFARPATFRPIKSQPNAASYDGRGIYSSGPYEVTTEDGGLFSDKRTIFDIIETEFSVLPKQGDTITIPAVASLPALGDFEIIDLDNNGGGEVTLTLRKILVAKP